MKMNGHMNKIEAWTYVNDQKSNCVYSLGIIPNLLINSTFKRLKTSKIRNSQCKDFITFLLEIHHQSY
jgi:hypothetical protein